MTKHTRAAAVLRIVGTATAAALLTGLCAAQASAVGITTGTITDPDYGPDCTVNGWQDGINDQGGVDDQLAGDPGGDEDCANG
jgi:hypothetical protein